MHGTIVAVLWALAGGCGTGYTDMHLGPDASASQGNADGAPPPPSGALYNDPARNVFDTYDPLCSGSDESIVFCDGFEDGEWFAVDDGHAASAGNDYWIYSAFFPMPDPTGRSYAECNGDAALAQRGAAGTPCTATQGWVDGEPHGAHGAHWAVIAGSDPTSAPAVGTDDYYVRFYFKEAGETSDRCPGGAPCPSFKQDGPNGYKAVEMGNVRDVGGINGGVLGTMFADGSKFTASPGQCAAQAEPLDVLYAGQNISSFDHKQHRDEWIFVEFHLRETSDGVSEVWMDACGRDGRQCSGTPTLRVSWTGYDYTNTCGPGQTGELIRSIWINFWNTSMTGEIQVDELVVRDARVTNEPIGFAPVLGG